MHHARRHQGRGAVWPPKRKEKTDRGRESSEEVGKRQKREKETPVRGNDMMNEEKGGGVGAEVCKTTEGGRCGSPEGGKVETPEGGLDGGSSWLESPEGSVVGARSGHELAHARHAPPGMRKLMPSPRLAGREPAHARQRACGQQTSKRQGMRHGKQTYQHRCGKQKQGTRHDKQTINAGAQSVRGRAADKVAGSTCRLYGPQC